MRAKTKAPLGASLIVLSSAFYASYGIWVTLIGDFLGGYMASAIRAILVLMILVPLAWMGRKFEVIRWRRDWPWFLVMLLTSALVWGPLYYAILHAGVGISLGVNYAALVMGMFFFGWLLAKERFTRDKWISVILGVIGLWLVFSPSVEGVGWLALSGALISGLVGASHSVIWKRLEYGPTQIGIIVWVIVALACFPAAFMLGEALPAAGWHIEWFYLLLFAVASLLANWTFVAGIKLVEAGAAGVLGLLEVVFAIGFGVIFFSERPGAIVLTGIAAIIVAAAIPYLKDYNAKKGTLEEEK